MERSDQCYTPKRSTADHDSSTRGNSLIERMFRLPFTMFNAGMDIMTRGMRGGSSTTGSQCVDAMVSRMAHPCAPAQESKWRPCDDKRTSGDSAGWVRDRPGRTDTQSQSSCTGSNSSYTSTSKGNSLNAEGLKLVRYKVLFVKRDLESVLEQRDELISDKLSDQDFTSWKTAEFVQRLAAVSAPSKWVQKNYPQQYAPGAKAMIVRIPDGDQKYLRVYFEVIDSYPQEEFNFDEREVDALEGIRDAINKKVSKES